MVAPLYSAGRVRSKLAGRRRRVHGSFMSGDDESVYEKELGGKLLAAVSRSFYLTLKALPKELREPVSLAYLLARTADTMADTAAVPESVRGQCLRAFAALIREPDAAAEALLAAKLAAEFAPLQTDAAERRLMERMDGALAWLRTLRGEARVAVLEVLERIIAGQLLDIERFPADGGLRSLRTRAELDDYTWRVAGCVGEFWTRLCASELEAAFAEGVTLEEMTADGTRMGKGLQLVNILRDVGKDMTLGRCYLPEEDWRGQAAEPAKYHASPGRESSDQLAQETTEASELRANSQALRPAWEFWATVCAGHLEAGLRYVCRLRHAKLRYATALPLMLAFGTLRKLRQASWEEVMAGVKVSRLDVARLLPETMVTNRSEAGLRAQAARWGFLG